MTQSICFSLFFPCSGNRPTVCSRVQAHTRAHSHTYTHGPPSVQSPCQRTKLPPPLPNDRPPTSRGSLPFQILPVHTHTCTRVSPGYTGSSLAPASHQVAVLTFLFLFIAKLLQHVSVCRVSGVPRPCSFRPSPDVVSMGTVSDLTATRPAGTFLGGDSCQLCQLLAVGSQRPARPAARPLPAPLCPGPRGPPRPGFPSDLYGGDPTFVPAAWPLPAPSVGTAGPDSPTTTWFCPTFLCPRGNDIPVSQGRD